MRLDPRHIVLPVVVALVALLVLALDTSAARSCAQAQDQLNHGFIAQATADFDVILKADPGSACAHQGVNGIVTARCDRAEKEAMSALFSNALAIYEDVLKGHPLTGCASGGVETVITTLCRRAAVFKKAGDGDAATKAYDVILAVEPLQDVPPCPGDGLSSSSGDSGKSPAQPDPAVVVIGGGKGKDRVIVVRGANGRNGLNGKAGNNGTNGTNGRDGSNGRNGTNGSNGRNGAKGRNGDNGRNGQNGKNAPIERPWTG